MLSRLPAKCKECGIRFTPEERAKGNPLHPSCIGTYADKRQRSAIRKATATAKKAARAEREADKAKAEKLKTRREWLAECQVVANKYVRLRDAGKGCISCGSLPEQKYGGTMDAGHWRSVGSAPHLRFYLPQIAAQCVKCNRYLGGCAVEFRKGLIQRLGVARVEEIEAMQGTAKWTVAYLERFKRVIGKRLRRMEKRLA